MMRSLHVLSVAALALLLGACDACEHPAPGPRALDPDAPLPSEMRTAQGSQNQGTDAAGRLDFLERTTGGARADEPLPMIVAIHGLGDRPENWLARWDDFPVRARIILPRAPEPWHGGGSWFPYPPSSMESLATTVGASADRVAALLAALVKERPTRGKPIVTGFSQGGFLTFALGARHPEVVSCALPMSGMLPPPLVPSAAPEGAPPIFATHGTADDIVPIDGARDSVARLKAAGFRVELSEYPGVEHTISPGMRKDLDARMSECVARAGPAAH